MGQALEHAVGAAAAEDSNEERSRFRCKQRTIERIREKREEKIRAEREGCSPHLRAALSYSGRGGKSPAEVSLSLLKGRTISSLSGAALGFGFNACSGEGGAERELISSTLSLSLSLSLSFLSFAFSPHLSIYLSIYLSVCLCVCVCVCVCLLPHHYHR